MSNMYRNYLAEGDDPDAPVRVRVEHRGDRALTCDLAIACERAVIVPAFGKLGLLPEVGTSWAITRHLGYQGAYAYYLRGEHIDAQAALRMGLVQEVVAHEQLLVAANRWC